MEIRRLDRLESMLMREVAAAANLGCLDELNVEADEHRMLVWVVGIVYDGLHDPEARKRAEVVVGGVVADVQRKWKRAGNRGSIRSHGEYVDPRGDEVVLVATRSV